MSTDPKFQAQLVTEDEHAYREVWQFEFKRATARAMLAFVKADAAQEDGDKVELILVALRGVIASVKRNGEPSSIDDMPFELNCRGAAAAPHVSKL